MHDFPTLFAQVGKKFKIKFKISNLDKTVDTQIAGKPTQAGKIRNGPAVHNTKLHEMKQHERQPTPKKLKETCNRYGKAQNASALQNKTKTYIGFMLKSQ